jgi:hypothetical protein
VTAEESAILKRLDHLVRLPGARAAIRPVVARVLADLARKPAAVMTWEPLPLAIYGNRLPPGIQSSWIFILRAGINAVLERHPNSHRRMMSLEGVGDLRIRADSDSPWQSHVLKNEPESELETRWVFHPAKCLAPAGRSGRGRLRGCFLSHRPGRRTDRGTTRSNCDISRKTNDLPGQG